MIDCLRAKSKVDWRGLSSPHFAEMRDMCLLSYRDAITFARKDRFSLLPTRRLLSAATIWEQDPPSP